jgi:hypothetical protein
VSSCIQNSFQEFIPALNEQINDYDIYFHHDHFTRDTYFELTTKYTRRIQRLLSLLQSSDEELLFCRKGHAVHHHGEHNGRYRELKNDIEDAEKLNAVLSVLYPQLKYKIIVFLLCGRCFDTTKEYRSNSDRIEVHNIAMTEESKDKSYSKFEDYAGPILIELGSKAQASAAPTPIQTLED